MNLSKIIILFCLLLHAAIFAQTKSQILLSADQSEYSANQKSVTFDRNVLFSFENRFKLRADQMQLRFDEDNNVHSFLATGNLVLCSDDFYIITQKVRYRKSSDILTLQGDTQFFYAGFQIESDHIIFNTKSKNIQIKTALSEQLAQITQWQTTSYKKQRYQNNDGCQNSKKPSTTKKIFYARATTMRWFQKIKKLYLNHNASLRSFEHDFITQADDLRIYLAQSNTIKLIKAEGNFYLDYQDDKLSADQAHIKPALDQIELFDRVLIQLKNQIEFQTSHALFHFKEDGLELSSSKLLRLKIDE